MRWHPSMGALTCCVALGVAGPAAIADPPQQATDQPVINTVEKSADAAQTVRDRAIDADQKILAAKTFRTSKLIGMNVRNMQGEALGTIDDFVVDLRTGKVQYAAMSVGGVLGLGDKLLAVPFNDLKFDHGQDEMFFVLNVTKERIAAAQGFNQQDWPDSADANWSTKIERQYRESETRTGDNETTPRVNNER